MTAPTFVGAKNCCHSEQLFYALWTNGVYSLAVEHSGSGFKIQIKQDLKCRIFKIVYILDGVNGSVK